MDVPTQLVAAGAKWEFSLSQQEREVTLLAKVIDGEARNVAFGLECFDGNWSEDNYLLYPGSVYKGNRFHSQQFDYSPPPNGPSLADEDQTLHLNEIPQLAMEGSSRLELLSNDCATPAIGVHFPASNRGLVLLTDLIGEQGHYGFEVEENEDHSNAIIRVMSPGILHGKIHGLSGYQEVSDDRGIDVATGFESSISIDWHEFACGSVQCLFDYLFDHREDRFELSPLKKEIPFSAVWDILHHKHNHTNWIEQYGLYQTSISNDPTPPFNLFQSGWCGGAITTLPMLQEGDEQSIDRSIRNLELLFEGQTEFGLFQEYFDGTAWIGIKGKEYCADARPWTLTRRIGDMLYFLLRQMMLLGDRGLADIAPIEWIDSLQRNLEAVEKIWKQNGTIGQYVNVHTGMVEVSASTSGALIPAGLVLAHEYFQEDRWLELAIEIAEDYRTKDLAQGIVSGGPGDCLQAPDSESIAALIESFALLHDATGEAKWKEAARDATVQLASWAYSFDCDFPKDSALGSIGAQSRGAMIANVQNRCGVPGICTLSGEGILRTFRATEDWSLLEFLRDLSHTIPQYMGRKDKLIPTRSSWGRKGVTHQPEGWVCERVNVGRWGGEQIGEIAAYSCWCETSLMLVWNDLPGIYCDAETGKTLCIDHLSATVDKSADQAMLLSITNPTDFNSKVKVLIETAAERKSALPTNAGAQFNTVEVPAGQTVTIPI